MIVPPHIIFSKNLNWDFHTKIHAVFSSQNFTAELSIMHAICHAVMTERTDMHELLRGLVPRILNTRVIE